MDNIKEFVKDLVTKDIEGARELEFYLSAKLEDTMRKEEKWEGRLKKRKI